MSQKIYVAIDLKSFYASVECSSRGLDPLTTHLVVADSSRSEKTICLAVSPSLKAYGISGRARLFEVIQKVKEINEERRRKIYNRKFTDTSYDDIALKKNPSLELEYIVAPPRMAYYIECSTYIYEIYLKYVSCEDIHVYSIDEVFMDVTSYLDTYNKTPQEFVSMIIQDIYKSTRITATAGIGTNLYLCKVAMDIVAKHKKPDKNGVRIAYLDEMTYRKLLWTHMPLTDFWRVGRGYAKKLEKKGLYTMGDIARCSLGKVTDYYNEDLLYQLFGINAELLIDHAWGYESCTMKQIKEYQPENNSVGSGQVLHRPYNYKEAEIVLKEMLEALSLDLVDKGLVTNQIVMTVGYDISNKKDNIEMKVDRYGRKIPKHSHGTENLDEYTSSTMLITEAGIKLYHKILHKDLLIRRLYITANHVIEENVVVNKKKYHQLDIFSDYNEVVKNEEQTKKALKKEKDLQKAMLDIKKKFGKSAVLKGTDLQDGATQLDRNKQIGGHKA